MLRAIFTVPWSLKHPCCIRSLPITVVGSGLVQDSKLGHWSSGASANQYNYNRPSPDTLTTHNLCSCSKGFETITLKSIHGFKLGSAKSMFALFYFYFFTFPMIFPLQIQCVCVRILFVQTVFIIFVRMLVVIFCMAMQSNVILKYKVRKSEDA